MITKIKDKIIGRIVKRLSEQNFIAKASNIGKNNFLSGAKIIGHVKTGDNCRIFNACVDGIVEIGDNTSIWGPNIMITSKFNKIKIGNFCSIARNVSIQEYNHKIDTLSTYHIGANILNRDIKDDLYSNGAITIGNDVWIGAGVVILSGVNIGNGAVLGANSLISKDVPPFAIVGGNPAKILKYRFSESEIEKITKLAWWDWSIEQIKENQEIFLKKYKILD